MRGTSLSILHGRKASRFVHGRRHSAGLSVEVGLVLLGLYLGWGKLRLVTSRSCSGSSSSQKPLLWPVCRLRLACSQSFLSPPPSSVGLHRTATILSLASTLLLITGWHPTAYHRLAPYCHSWAGTLLPLMGWLPTAHRRWLASPQPSGSARRLSFRSVGPSSVTPSRGIAPPPSLCPTPWIDVMTYLTVQHGFGGPFAGVFLCRRSTKLSRRAAFLAVRVFSFVLVSRRKGLGLSMCMFLCIVSLRV